MCSIIIVLCLQIFFVNLWGSSIKFDYDEFADTEIVNIEPMYKKN